MNLFDSHCHLEDERFADDRADVMARMEAAGVSRCLLAGSDLDSSARIVKLTREHPNVYGVVGVHPHEAKGWTDGCEAQIAEWMKEKRIVGVGEIGLDYYYDLSPRETQREVFEKQLLLAKRLDRPVCFHIRDAHGDVLSILRAHRGELPAGVIHCCSASAESAREYLDMGFYISFAGPITFKNANKLLDVARLVPDDRIMVETDSPYLAPVPMRGKRNEPAYVRHVAQRVAELRGVDEEALAQLAFENTCRLYGIPLAPLTIRAAAEGDLPRLLSLYANARAFMAQHGNPDQWAGGYPAPELLREDIRLGHLYVCERQEKLLAAFVLAMGEDPTYAAIEDGVWENNQPYGTIHRLASSGEEHGLTDEVVRWAFARIGNLRADTHEKNLPMQRAFERCGFRKCGIIHVADGTARLAYQKTE